MPPVVRRYIKTSFIFFFLGLLVGAFITVNQGLLGREVPLLLIVAHTHVLLVGFVLMMIIGVATWMFPRLTQGDTRYRPGMAEAIYWIMTLSTALRFAAEILGAYRPGSGFKLLVTVGGLGQILAGFLFVLNIWARVRAPSIISGKT